jgi:hypothetical protein
MYSSPDIIRVIKIKKIEIGGACSMFGSRRGVYSVMVGKLDGKRTLRRPRRR